MISRGKRSLFLEVAAVLIRALVGEGRKELVDEIAVRAVQFNGVIARIAASADGLYKTFDQLFNLSGGELMRGFRPGRILNGRRGHGTASMDGTVGFPSRMVDLNGDFLPRICGPVRRARHGLA